jgi:tetratricopeptide (TPR) repeat protein
MSNIGFPSEASGLFEKLRQQKIILFVGNGASVDAGGPTTKQLVSLIKTRFKDATYSNDDFIQTCTDVMETSFTSRRDLEDYIVRILYDLKPSPFHMELPLSIWPAIFTTNYDDLIEKAYRAISDSRVQLPEPIFSNTDPLALHDREKVKVFKLMGCITSQHPDNKLIFTREDYNTVLRKRNVLFNILRDIMRDGTILYVGYSFRDYLLSDVYTELIQTIGLQNLPYSYALMPDIDPSSVQATKLREKRVIPLKMTATEFIECKRKQPITSVIPLKQKGDIELAIKGVVKRMPHKDARQFCQSFDFLSADSLSQIQPDAEETRRDFFRGLIKDWTGYVKNWDFKRAQYDTIFEIIRNALADSDVGKNKSLMIFGPAGSGKTFLTHRIALDAYRNLGNPVVIFRPYYEDMDLKLLSSLCEELASVESGPRPHRGLSRARVLVIMESAAANVIDFRTIPVFLKSRGIPALLVGSTRENDWENACQRNYYQSTETNSVTLSDSFESQEERLGFARHLKSLGIVEPGESEQTIVDVIKKDCHNSFFASMYSLVEPSRPRLEEKIDDEYSHLSELGKRAYCLVSSLYQYSLPIPIEWLVRTLGCPYDQFLDEIYRTDAKKVICEVEGPPDSIYLAVRHRIVAEKIVEKQIREVDELVKVFEALLRNLNPGNLYEILICRSLLIRYLGPNGIERRLSDQQVRQIFSAAVYDADLKDPSILHHFGLFESDKHDQKRAIELVEEALKIMKQKHILPFQRTERVENLYNTLGVIYSRKGQAAEAIGETPEAESAYSVASDYFNRAKGSISPNPHPYDSECRMHLYRAERVDTVRGKLIIYLKAIDIINEAEDNLAEEDMPRFFELKARIQEGLKSLGDQARIVAELRKGGTSEADLAVIEARLTLLEQTSSQDSLERAYAIVKSAVASGDHKLTTLRTYTSLHQKLHPDDLEELYKILKTRHQIPDEQRNLSLLYELGRLSFTFGDYGPSREYFSSLERISQGHPKRWGIRDRGLNRAGDSVEFSGAVVRFDRNLGYVEIPEIRRQAPFLPLAQKFQPQIGDNVTFNIGFNYRGWLAIDLSK